MRYKSCHRVQRGYNFYRSGLVTACCERISPDLNYARADDPELPEKILAGRERLALLHKSGNAPSVCQSCDSFHENDWGDALPRQISTISLNHYRQCNLKCVHCGYRRFDARERDTPHEAVFAAIQNCVSAGICSSRPFLEVGGGEPSLALGLEPLFAHALANDWPALINSNGARFSPLFAEGVNRGDFTLLLTPDAGSREIYFKIKGVDNFDKTWRNIGRYMAATSSNALVKFILEEGNRGDIPAMIETSKKYGVKNLVLSLDMNIPLKRRAEFFGPIKEFLLRARNAGMTVRRGAFLPDF